MRIRLTDESGTGSVGPRRREIVRAQANERTVVETLAAGVDAASCRHAIRSAHFLYSAKPFKKYFCKNYFIFRTKHVSGAKPFSILYSSYTNFTLNHK